MSQTCYRWSINHGKELFLLTERNKNVYLFVACLRPKILSVYRYEFLLCSLMIKVSENYLMQKSMYFRCLLIQAFTSNGDSTFSIKHIVFPIFKEHWMWCIYNCMKVKVVFAWKAYIYVCIYISSYTIYL